MWTYKDVRLTMAFHSAAGNVPVNALPASHLQVHQGAPGDNMGVRHHQCCQLRRVSHSRKRTQSLSICTLLVVGPSQQRPPFPLSTPTLHPRGPTPLLAVPAVGM
jgi:hypothetical protein